MAKSSEDKLLSAVLGVVIGGFIGAIFTMAACGPHGTVHEGPGWPITLFGALCGACIGLLTAIED